MFYPAADKPETLITLVNAQCYAKHNKSLCANGLLTHSAPLDCVKSRNN